MIDTTTQLRACDYVVWIIFKQKNVAGWQRLKIWPLFIGCVVT